MSWYSYFRLLQKYKGDLRLATKDELNSCRAENHLNPSNALEVATEYYEEQRTKLSRVSLGIKNRS